MISNAVAGATSHYFCVVLPTLTVVHDDERSLNGPKLHEFSPFNSRTPQNHAVIALDASCSGAMAHDLVTYFGRTSMRHVSHVHTPRTTFL